MLYINLVLLPSADIDVHTRFTLTENEKGGTLQVQMNMSGDQYPAAEAFITDARGNSLFLGVSPAVGYDDRKALGPYLKLPGDNNLPMVNSSFTIYQDGGIFTGVRQGGNAYTPAEWNSRMQGQPTEKMQEKLMPEH